ncbi:MAG TPA: Rieske 2Fe-2S domain-containing protein [Burkholderiaceae bacterium]|nr:Rieske 2Fe-2S domain-containing protein [Burkholderiaceae bacterium]
MREALTFPLPLEAVPDNRACAVRRVVDGVEQSVVILRRGSECWAYVNRCPHFSIPLDFEPGTFATYDGEVLMCAHHSALFRFEDGRCIDGPCAGQRLEAVPIRVIDRTIDLR